MSSQDKLTEVEKAEMEAKLYQSVQEQIFREKPFAEELSQYRDSDVESFYKSLVDEKVHYMLSGPYWYKRKQEAESEWISAAMKKGLKEIQQKKLFDIQCLWDAEKITLPGIEASIDLNRYWKNPLSCPFLEPITEEEFQMYINYLVSEVLYDYDNMVYNVEDYKEMRDSVQNNTIDNDLPEWYDFHNQRTGKGVYLLYPMLRTQKEAFYRNLYWANKEEKENTSTVSNEAHEEPKPESHSTIQPPNHVTEMQHLPKIWAHDKGTVDFFVSTFEDRGTQTLYKKYQRMYRGIHNSDYDYHGMINELTKHGDVWPIGAHHDWREAFFECYIRYKQHKVAEALPIAYAQYKMYLEMNIPFEEEGEYNNQEMYADLSKTIKSQILKGRELNNEPPNFYF